MSDDTSNAMSGMAQQLKTATISADATSQEKIYFELDLALSGYAEFDQVCLVEILASLADKKVQKSRDSVYFFKLIEFNKDLLSSAQIVQTSQCLVDQYAGFDDPAALILMLEILIDLHNDEQSVKLIQTLIRSSRGTALAMTATGLSYLCRRSSDAAILKKILGLATRLTQSPQKDVKAEAQAVKRRIEQKLAAV